MSGAELPTPLTPVDCDLRGMPFMPLEVMRVMQSTTFALSTGDEFKAAFALWCASWMEVPAASLPDDDEMLEYLSRSKNWKKVKAKALRGWILCSDGRLYHSVVAKNALEAWDRRLDYQESSNNKTERQKRWRERCKQLSAQLRTLGIDAPRGASLETLEQMLVDATVDGKTSTQSSTETSTVDDVEIGKTGTGTVKGQGELIKPPHTPQEGGAPAEPKKERKKREGEPLQAYLDRCKASGVKPIPADDSIFEYVRDVRLTEEMLVLAWFVFKNKYLNPRKLQKDWLAHYRNAVKDNWYKLWYFGSDDTVSLTTAGVQAQREMEAKNRKAA